MEPLNSISIEKEERPLLLERILKENLEGDIEKAEKILPARFEVLRKCKGGREILSDLRITYRRFVQDTNIQHQDFEAYPVLEKENGQPKQAVFLAGHKGGDDLMIIETKGKYYEDLMFKTVQNDTFHYSPDKDLE